MSRLCADIFGRNFRSKLGPCDGGGKAKNSGGILQKLAFWAAVIIAPSAWVVWFLQFQIMEFRGVYWNIESAGQWGDTFGALNTLFSGFAFIALFWSVRSQQAQINAQSERDNIEAFESHYFQLLELSRELKDNVKFGPRHGISGDQAMMSLARNLMTKYRLVRSRDGGQIEEAALFELAYKLLFGENGKDNQLRPYFRIIYTILRRIYESGLEPSDKIKYGNLLRSQLTEADLKLIGINGLLERSGDLRKYIIEFRLLKYLHEPEIRKILEGCYPKEAFEGRD